MKRSVVFAATSAAAVLSVPVHANDDVPSLSLNHTRIPSLFQTCADLNRRYAHGVGRVGARDRTSRKPVTNFKRSNAIYAKAMSYNLALDPDRDGIACEKA